MTKDAHRVAYLINAYKQPALLVRLVDRLSSPQSSFVLHVDRKSAGFDDVLAALAARDNVTLLPRRPIYWGSSALVQVFVAGLRTVARDLPDVGHVVYLTAQDYPMWPCSEIESFLAARPHASFVNHLPLPQTTWIEGGRTRYERFHHSGRFGRVEWPGHVPGNRRWLRPLWSLTTRFARPRRFPAGLSPYGGSGVWALSGEAVRYVVSFLDQRPDVMRFFRWVLAPDEMLIQSVMMSGPLADSVIDSDLHHTRWEPMSAHPVIFTASELDELERSPEPFVRKVDLELSDALLDALDARALSARRSEPS